MQLGRKLTMENVQLVKGMQAMSKVIIDQDVEIETKMLLL